MRSPYPFIFLLFVSGCSLAQQSQNCNQAVRNNRLTSKLDSSICIPQGYHITDVYEVDLNSDNLEDKMVGWRKIKATDGDTLFYSLYTKEDSGAYMLRSKFSNLEPLYFKNYSDNYRTGSRYLDSIKSRYVGPELARVNFDKNNIVLSFYTEATLLRKLFFTYSVKENTWILTREMQWLVPPRNYEGDEKLDENGRKLEYDRAPEASMRTEDFDMLKYIGW